MAIWTEDQLREFSKDAVPRISRKGAEALKTEQGDPERVLEVLLNSAEDPSLSAAHKVAAFNALSGFLDQGLRSSDDMRTRCTNRSTFQRAVQIYLQKTDGFTSGAIQRLLNVLANIPRAQTQEISQEVLHRSALECLTKILDHDDPAGVKPSMLLLTKFLSKNCLSPKQILSYLSEIPGTFLYASEDFERLGHFFVVSILEWVGINHASISATNLIVRFCKTCELVDEFQGSKLQSADLWLTPVRQLLCQDDSMYEVLERHALPDLFRINVGYTYEAFGPSIEQLRSSYGRNMTDIEVRITLMALRKMGSDERLPTVNPDASNRGNLVKSHRVTLIEIAQHLLFHRSSNIHNSALDLLASTYKPPQHIPASILDTIIQSLHGFHAEGDAQARSDFLSVAKRLVSRLESSQTRLIRDIEAFDFPPRDDSTSEDLVRDRKLHEANVERSKEHERFADAYAKILACGLRISAPYQQHISCLRMVEFLASSPGSLAWHVKLCFPMAQTLIALVMDPYDDVRAAASSSIRYMLQNFPSEHARAQLQDNLGYAVLHAEDIIVRAQRADLADGYGRLHNVWYDTCPNRFELVNSLLQKLESDLAAAREDFQTAIASSPIQGHLIALRYILGRTDVVQAFEGPDSRGAWRSFHERLKATFHQVWQMVQPILCIDSPDGADFVDSESTVEVGMKDTLSYAWRALKEVTSLMQTIISAPAYAAHSERAELQYEDYKLIGSLTFLQLTELRHKGAFSTVAQTFAVCCIACSRCKDERVQRLLDDWLTEMLRSIEVKSNALTRRSAGLPSIAIGVLIARKNQGSVDDAIQDLKAIAQLPVNENSPFSESKLPQVHALNCLKEAVVHSALGPAMEPHIPNMTELAALCLESKVWAIRNCGLMLLKALVTRLASRSATSTARPSDQHRTYAKTTYEKFPGLSELIVALLTRSARLMDDSSTLDDQDLLCENGLSTLQIITKLGIVPKDRPRIKTLLNKHLGSRIWSLRVLAARCLSTIITLDEIFSAVHLALVTKPPSTNMIHGYLVCLQEYLQVRPSLAESALTELFAVGTILVTPRACPFVLTVYLQNICFAIRKCYEVTQLNLPKASVTLQTGDQPTQSDGMMDLQGKLREITNDSLPDELRYAMIATGSLLGKCVFPVPQENRTYPLSTYHIDASCIPSLAAVKLASCESGKIDDLSMIRESIVLDRVSHLASRYATQHAEQLKEFPLKEDVRSTAARLRIMCDSLMDSGQNESDDVYAQNLVYFGAAMPWTMADDSEETSQQKLSRLQRYTRILQLALLDDSEYIERFAAVSSIGHYVPTLDLLDLTDGTIEVALKMYTLLLKALSDDEEDIRSSASEVVYTSFLFHIARQNKSGNNVGVPDVPCCPFDSLTAQRTIMTMLVDGLGKEMRFFTHCLSAIIGEDITPAWSSDKRDSSQLLYNSIKSARYRFAVASQDRGSILFQEERAILFLDEVQDVDLWKSALLSAWNQLPYAQTPSVLHLLLKEIGAWLIPGLRSMQEYIDTDIRLLRSASSTRDIFVLGMRYLVLAEVLVHMEKRLPYRDLEDIAKQLRVLQETGVAKGMDDHWARKIEDILDVLP